jgi:hypothetical protein
MHIQDIINRSTRVEGIIRDKYREVYGENLPNSGPTVDQPQGGGNRTKTGVEWSIEP